MTEKQEKILDVALKMFAEKGYHATSTSKVAREAGVSEGLIFRHFGNKDGLLQAIMESGRERATALYANILNQGDPKEVLKSVIEMPFSIGQDQYYFWKLLYGLKWQADVYDDTMSKPLREALTRTFTKLGYSDPVAETELIMMMIDGAAVAVLLRKPQNLDAVKDALLAKYDLN